MSALTDAALPLLKTRLNRKTSDTALDTFLTPLLESSELELTRKGIALQDDADDKMLLVDYAHWRYKSRDEPGGMPQWLALRLRERWLSPKGRDTGDA